MSFCRLKFALISLATLVMLASCSSLENQGINESATEVQSGRQASSGVQSGSSILDAFKDKGRGVKVNRFLWTASLDVLDFLPVQSADPFTGVITTGYGRPPGGGTAYRATILISDPSLDARALNVALQTNRGPVSEQTRQAVEDAIMTRARQLRVQAGRY